MRTTRSRIEVQSSKHSCINHMCLKAVAMMLHSLASDLEHWRRNIDPGDRYPLQATPRLVFPFRRERPRSSCSSEDPRKSAGPGASQVGYQLGPRGFEIVRGRSHGRPLHPCSGRPNSSFCHTLMPSSAPASLGEVGRFEVGPVTLWAEPCIIVDHNRFERPHGYASSFIRIGLAEVVHIMPVRALKGILARSLTLVVGDRTRQGPCQIFTKCLRASAATHMRGGRDHS